jgi:hypothetical protein
MTSRTMAVPIGPATMCGYWCSSRDGVVGGGGGVGIGRGCGVSGRGDSMVEMEEGREGRCLSMKAL